MTVTIVEEAAWEFTQGVRTSRDLGASLVHGIIATGSTDFVKLAIPAETPFASVQVTGIDGTLYLTDEDAEAETNGIAVDASAAPVSLELTGATLIVDPDGTVGAVFTLHPGLRSDQAQSQTTDLS